MKPRTWVLLGATSIIAEHFAHLAAAAANHLRLVGRDAEQLSIIAGDIEIRYKVPCELFIIDMTEPADKLLACLISCDLELDLFIAHSDFTLNDHLSSQAITNLINVNILATTQLIHAYLCSPQKEHNVLYLSSVAACRGRAQNSLYGASKAAIEIYLQGLQQAASKDQHITIARLGYIDTKQTYGVTGIFLAAQPKDCAKACWSAMGKKKLMFYFPRFWRAIMAIITRLPFFIFRYVP